jgi:hypothetical protein
MPFVDGYSAAEAQLLITLSGFAYMNSTRRRCTCSCSMRPSFRLRSPS